MPRITLIAIQLALLVGIASLSVVIVQKQRHSGDFFIDVLPSGGAESIGNADNPPKKPYSHYRSIGQRDLFRTPSQKKVEKEEINIDDLKPTALKLKLWGTITGPDQVKRAVVEDATQRRQAIYREQDTLASAKIKKILRDKIILSVKGEDQILEIEKPQAAGIRAPAPRPAGPKAGGTASKSAPKASGKKSAARLRVKWSTVQGLAENPEKWDQFAAASPQKLANGTSGIALNRVTPSSPLRRLGLRNGDFLTAIDGRPPASLKDLADVFGQAGPGKEISMQLKRRGRIRDIILVFQ